jgi:hypothetical protein
MSLHRILIIGILLQVAVVTSQSSFKELFQVRSINNGHISYYRGESENPYITSSEDGTIWVQNGASNVALTTLYNPGLMAIIGNNRYLPFKRVPNSPVGQVLFTKGPSPISIIITHSNPSGDYSVLTISVTPTVVPITVGTSNEVAGGSCIIDNPNCVEGQFCNPISLTRPYNPNGQCVPNNYQYITCRRLSPIGVPSCPQGLFCLGTSQFGEIGACVSVNAQVCTNNNPSSSCPTGQTCKVLGTLGTGICN